MYKMIAMNEVFEYRRFGALARKYYRENRRLGIIFLGIIGIITFLCLCKFNPFLREYTQVENPAEVSDFIQYYKGYIVSCSGDYMDCLLWLSLCILCVILL